MKAVIILEDQLNSWLQALGSGHQLFGPVKSKKRQSVISWSKIEKWDQLSLTNSVPTSSIKTFYFPQPETLFTFSAKWNDPNAFRMMEPKTTHIPTLLVGVKPCDARSVMLNALPYKNDPYFQARLDSISIIATMCLTQSATCFCRWVGGSPLSTDFIDLALYPIDKGYIAEPLTQKGEKLIEQAPETASLNDSQLEFFKNIKQNEQAERAKSPNILKNLKEKELMQLYDAPFWHELAEPCLNCGICTFLCPTCYCFDIQDETVRNKGRRIRYWDSCMFPLFTLHASGHNPRGQKFQRVRNRFMHKLKYFPDRFDHISCVGCGRCIKECPVNIDIRQVISSMLEVE